MFSLTHSMALHHGVFSGTLPEMVSGPWTSNQPITTLDLNLKECIVNDVWDSVRNESIKGCSQASTVVYSIPTSKGTSGRWSERGCRTVAQSNGRVMCSCEHFEHVAVLTVRQRVFHFNKDFATQTSAPHVQKEVHAYGWACTHTYAYTHKHTLLLAALLVFKNVLSKPYLLFFKNYCHSANYTHNKNWRR